MAEHGMECTFIDIMILVVGGIFSGFCLDSSPVFGLVAHVQVKGFALGGTVGVGVVQEILYSHEDLFDGNGRAPAFFFIQNGQTNGPTGIDIGVKQGRHKSTLGRFARILLVKLQRDLVHTTGPIGRFLSRNTRIPLHNVGRPIPCWDGSRIKSKWMILPPRLSLLTSQNQNSTII